MILALLVAGAVLPSTTLAADTVSAFDAANKLYEQGKFADAAGAYEKIVDGGLASPALYFNLGNALFKSGQIGRAITAYRQAEQLAPRDPDVRANLQFARNQVQGPTWRPTRWQRAFGSLSLNEWSGLAAAGVWLTFVMLAMMQLRPALKPALRSLTAAAGGATLVIGLGLCLAVKFGGADAAVVIARDVVVHNGPLDASPSAFTANDGAELRVLDHKDEWLQVTDGNGRIGWLKRGEVALLAKS